MELFSPSTFLPMKSKVLHKIDTVTVGHPVGKWQTLFCVVANFKFEVSKMKMTFLTPGTNVGIFSID